MIIICTRKNQIANEFILLQYTGNCELINFAFSLFRNKFKKKKNHYSYPLRVYALGTPEMLCSEFYES